MEPLFLWFSLLAGLLWSEISVTPSFARHLEATGYRPHVQTQLSGLYGPKHTVHGQQNVPVEEREQVNTVRVTCHPDSLDIVIKADLFGVGAPVNAGDLRLGVEDKDNCRATASSPDEFRILVGLLDCGHKHWMTENALIYTNLLIYSPAHSPDGVIRMEEAVIPIECHYDRKYSLSSSSLTPTWIPFISTQAAVEMLDFDLRLMRPDWIHERGSNMFYLGDPVGIEASVRVGHHMGLRVFLNSCAATLTPDIHSVPRYVFIKNGCLIDSQVPDSKSHFLPRMRDDKLQLVIDAFRFNNEDRGELYITCHMTAVPANDAEAPNKACTFINGRWRSADGNDYLCGYCQSQNEGVKIQGKSGISGTFSPRGFRKPVETSWRTRLRSNEVWEKETKVGPLLVLPAQRKSGALPEMELPPLLHKITKSSLYGSSWRTGIDMDTGLDKDDKEEEEEEEDDDGTADLSPEELSALKDLEKGLLPGSSTENVELNRNETTMTGDTLENEAVIPLEKAGPEVSFKTQPSVEHNATAATNKTSSSTNLDMTTRLNETDANSGFSETNGPKR
ncbi:zona pellucida sperm-binding protein 3-like [Sphaeramia orbicularis]|uniref:Zona pellucida sperm-binding protein 3 n=1 Tax=Sphaeramia orbicularis TaxID=375764 RepID=A0A672ZT10_9TELE|nr:zona pellucida sperm-binding protein 3-like [Sphaeramia orbicularis]